MEVNIIVAMELYPFSKDYFKCTAVELFPFVNVHYKAGEMFSD